MVAPFEEAATILHMKKEKRAEKGAKAYFTEKLRALMAEITAVYLRYGVSSREEVEEKINRGKLSESDTFDDFTGSIIWRRGEMMVYHEEEIIKKRSFHK